MKNIFWSLGIFLIANLTLINVQGVLARESTVPTTLGQNSIQKFAEAPALPDFWVIEEVFQQWNLPQYSENNFSGTPFVFKETFFFKGPKAEFEKIPFVRQRDLKNDLTIKLFPFHFFL